MKLTLERVDGTGEFALHANGEPLPSQNKVEVIQNPTSEYGHVTVVRVTFYANPAWKDSVQIISQ